MRVRSFSIAMILLTLAGCKPAEEKTPVRDSAINIRVQPVEYVAFKIPVRTTGLLSTTTQMKLSFKTGGIIKQLNIREGESVRKGDVLALLDLSEIRAQVNQTRIGLEKAERDLTRAKNLYRDSVATLEQYQNARSAYELARSRKQIADFNLLHSRIKAPSDGKIQKVLVETNEMIAPGYPAILFASTENDWIVRASLTDKDIVKLSIGDSGKVKMDAFPGTLFDAEVSELGTIADPVTGTYEVELMMLQSLPQFRTGFFSRVQIYPTEISRSLVVPVEALLDASDKRAAVFIYVQGKALRKRVITGSILQDKIEVLEGLEEGELVITDGAQYVTKDAKVVPVNLSDTQER
ncbi:MAG: efflux RND transporter periplasmic adaptor subunit [Bacteroidota bacterium]